MPLEWRTIFDVLGVFDSSTKHMGQGDDIDAGHARTNTSCRRASDACALLRHGDILRAYGDACPAYRTL